MAIHTLNRLDQFSCVCLAIRVGRRLSSADAIDTLADLFITCGLPSFTRSDNRPEFVAQTVKGWITGMGTQTASIEPDSSWENGYVETSGDKFRDELLSGEISNTPAEEEVDALQRRSP